MHLRRHWDQAQQRQATGHTNRMIDSLTHQQLGQTVYLYAICPLVAQLALVSFLVTGSHQSPLALLTLIFMLSLFCSSVTFIFRERDDGTRNLFIEREGEHTLLHEASSNSSPSQQPSSLIEIQIVDANNKLKICKALLDTGCLVGNWISYEKVVELGLRDQIITTGTIKAETFGSEVHCYGSIKLQWSLVGALKFHTVNFFVGASESITVILGNDFIQKYEAVRLNKWALAPLWESKPPTTEENEEIERNKRRVEIEAARAAARRKERAEKAAAEAAAAQRQSH
ncbi:hypothetical protein BJ875DRAFT_441160 [Amylocarpus encephaloides]|uniref:Uncharacterized protein n=1 Tax=Amylocarpus encephaloides TaxID=45428 RepID=A0A9P7YK41_9HELO|nr:hypothetical protein BJ875DRAFT_441160 [Amylocarpus encephaloides]